MVRLLVFGDTHFRATAFLQGEEFIEKALGLARNTKPDAIVLLGDLGDEHETARTAPAKQIERLLRGLLLHSPRVYAIMGNHDLIDNRQFLSDNHFFGPYKEWVGLTIVDTPVIAEFGGCKFVFCPFVEKGRFVEALDTLLYEFDPDDPENLEGVMETGLEWKDADCIFGHLEVRGVTYAGRVSTNGDKWSDEYPVLVSGHIHDACFIEPNVHYPGSSVQVAANENPDKRAWLMTFGNKGDPAIEKIDLGLKTIKEVKMDCADAKTFDWGLIDTYVIKLVLNGTQEELSLFRKSQLYAKFKRLGVRLGFTSVVDETPVFLMTGTSAKADRKKEKEPTFDEILRRLCKTKPESVQKVYRKICGDLDDSSSEGDSEESQSLEDSE